MSEYEKLLKELEEEVKIRLSMSWEELLSWGEKHDVGLVTLSLLLEELKRKGMVEVSPELELVDEHLEISIPRRITVKRPKAPAASKPKTVREKRPKGAREQQGALLKYLIREEAEEDKEGKRAEERSVGGPPAETVQRESEIAVAEVETPQTQAPAAVKDLAIALQYLRRYWSVGELRFVADLKSLGVSDPEGLLRRLVSEGLVTLAEPGVVNAKKEEVEKRVKNLGAVSTKSLADLFGF
jgi:hypothetical protein